MKTLSKIIVAVAAVATLSACGETVPAGSVGVKVKTLWGAGTDPTPLGQGWHMLGLGEEIHPYPTRQRLYSYTRDADERGNENEEMVFNDSRGLQMTGDVQIQAATRPDCVPELFNTWRVDFDDLIAGPIRLDTQAAISVETEKTTVEKLYSGERQIVLANALKTVKAKWHDYCVDVSQLSWAGPIRYPPTIMEAIQQKTATDQATQNAQAMVLQREAEARAAVAQATGAANAKIEMARGEAESARLLGIAITNNPQVLKQRWIERWDGNLPSTLIGDSQTVQMLLNLQK